ncbi:sigma-70 family RNA polymerase sigma factor [Pontibacter sp. JH31]|uniref:Sigma-70 family RNA polymerase sigma factor n=1 Tax=Pontibacter aquaedesilientis TaxID=2766980 RepID=A0ABR7XBK2_9BACT|nr:sigma-70 family RNA polymerase sigma factor [Pontibacter aquaedesilientis]MBD1395684.1 sigma-70 family RNA polymerase sigma factor [Pontibacter aquaedesilientis]
MDELAVWESFKAGSEEGFSLLYGHFAPVMLRYGNRMCPDRELVRDCMQQVFFTLWKSREALGSPVSVRNYLFKCLRNEIVRKANHTSQHDSLPENYHFEQEDSYEQVLIQVQTAELTKQRIAELLTRLPARQREVIFLKYYANLKYDEISAIMDIEQESVYKITYKAIAKLQQFLTHTPLLLLSLFVF